MAVSVLVNGEQTVVADLLSPGTITKIGTVLSIYTGSEWLPCDGSPVLRTQYEALFEVIGTYYGSGNGSTDFNLPTKGQAKNRPLLQFSASPPTPFTPFTDDTDIVMTNPSLAAIDISAGAIDPGTRLSIIEKTTFGVTIYTDAGPNHTQSCVLPQGTIVLEWDGSQWCLVGKTARIRLQFTTNSNWKTPFAAIYRLMPVGGGGGGGPTGASNQWASGGPGGGGGGGGASIYDLPKPAGAGLVITIGGGGANSANGGNSTISDGTITIIGPGGSAGGGGGSATQTGSTSGAPGGPGPGGSGGRTPGITGQIVVPGNDGVGGGGVGGLGAWNSGSNGGNAGNHAGSAGKAFIEF